MGHWWAASPLIWIAAKGLEFPAVFMAGLEEGLFPISRSLENRDDLEEERRLFYVGATRAEEILYISWCGFRRRFGESKESIPSRFLREIDPSVIEHNQLRQGFQTPASLARRRLQQRRRTRTQEMPDYENYSQEVNGGITAGTRVRHVKFGDGVIKGISGSGENAKVTVHFNSVGPKTLMVQYANLQII